MTTPAISVVVPFFDSERHVGDCVESLRRQEGVDGDYEVIMVDNGSTDGSRSILDGVADITLLEESTPGAYAARNTGVRHARAPIIAFTDADCVVAPDWLRNIQLALQDTSVAVLVGRCDYPAEASLSLRWLGAYEAAKAWYVINRCDPSFHFAYGNNMAVRASVFEEIGLFREWKRAGDTELVHRLTEHRPDLELRYERRMRITHLEFVSTRARLKRLRLYRSTNAQVSDFHELGLLAHLGVFGRWLRPGRRR